MSDDVVVEKVEEKVEKVVVEPEPELTVKDPRRVEQGKRLAKISQAAKEKKMRAKIEAERGSDPIYISDYIALVLSGLSFLGLGYLLFFGGPSSSPQDVTSPLVMKKMKKPQKRISPLPSPVKEPVKSPVKSPVEPVKEPVKHFETFG